MAGRHCTLYGDSLVGASEADIANLRKYDTLIVSPGVYVRVPVDLRGRCAVYFSLFFWPRYMAAAGDWQPGPGDMGMPQVEKQEGGHSYIYTVSWDWVAAFCSAMLRFALRNPFQRIFLEDWQISHSHWGLDNWRDYANPKELPELMRRVENVANWISGKWGAKDSTAIALSGYPEDFQDLATDWYVESFGAEWQSAIRVLPRLQGTDFIQVNSSDYDIRQAASALAGLVGGSVGMQPNDGVLSYNTVEDPDTW